MITTTATGEDGRGSTGTAPADGEPGVPLVGTIDDDAGGSVRFSSALLLVVPTLAVIAFGFARSVSAGVTSADSVRLELTLAWVLAAACLLVRVELVVLGRLVSVAALIGATAFAGITEGRMWSGAAGRDARLVATVLAALLMAVGFHFLLSVPDGRLGLRARRVAASVAYAGGLAFGLWAWTGPGRMTGTAAVIGWAVVVVTGLPAAARRYRRSSGIDRQRLEVLASGVVAAFEVALVVLGLAALVRWPASPWAVAVGATALVALGTAASTFPRLLGASDRLLVRLLSVAGTSAAVLAVYLLVVLGFGHTPGPGDRQVLGLSILAAAVVALGAAVFHERVLKFAQRVVYGDTPVPDDVVKTFGTRLTRAVTMEELLLQLTESLQRSMVLTGAEVYTGSGDLLERCASVPDRGPAVVHLGQREQSVVARAGVSGNAWTSVWLPSVMVARDRVHVRVCPITYGGDLLGLVVVERPTTEPPFTQKEDLVLTELSRQVGLALHNVRLDSALQSTLDEVRRQADELRASRSRIVAAADAERRRVERDLHDGAQQHLVALAVNVRLVRDQVAEDPVGAVAALDEIAAEVKATVQELRDLAHGIYPPLLIDNGLPEALRAVSARSPLEVRVRADGIGRFAPEVEAAVYFCCLEALQNSAKHAPDSHVEVRVWEEEGGLLFVVTDDGPGFDPHKARVGHGFINMSDRLGAIGGTVRWDSTPGSGSSIRGSVPLG